MPRRPYVKFTAAQVQQLRQHYPTLGPPYFAQAWGVGVRRVYELARRHGIRARAARGQARGHGGQLSAWGAGSRWA